MSAVSEGVCVAATVGLVNVVDRVQLSGVCML